MRVPSFPQVKKALLSLSFLAAITASVFTGVIGFKAKAQSPIGVTQYAGNNGGTWQMYDSFNGLDTKKDPEKVADSENVDGQNTVINDSDRISIRPEGYTLFPSTATQSTSTLGTTSAHTFHLINGTNIMMRFWGNEMDYFNPSSTQWELLDNTFTTGTTFGFADVNLNLQYNSFVYFGNAVDTSSRWSGGFSALTSAVNIGDSVVNVGSTASWYASSTHSIVLCGQALAYASSTATTFTLSSPSPIACANGSGVAQAIDRLAAAPRGNIYIVFNARLFIGGISPTTVFGGVTSSPQWVMFSAYGDATTFAQSLNPATYSVNAGIFDLSEGGGMVTGFAQDQNNLYIFKRSIIYDVTVNQDGTFGINPLKPFDGKSQTVGSVTSQSTFTGDNGVYFISADNQIYLLSILPNIIYPQISAISDPIKPTVDALGFANAAGVVYRNKAYIAVKSSPAARTNDTVLVYDIINKWWDSPIVGWDVANWMIYNDGSGKGDQLMWADASAPNVWQVTQDSNDDNYGFTATWKSKQFDFGTPSIEKQIDSPYVEGYISPNTSLTVMLLLNDNGFTQVYTTVIKGTETNFLFQATPFNLFGSLPFGTTPFGSNADFNGEQKFRVYLNKGIIATPFYNAQIEFASNDVSQHWEILNFGFRVRQWSQQENPALYRVFQ